MRIYIVNQGGQFFWPDETRYFLTQNGVKAFLSGDLQESLFWFTHGFEHFLFRFINLIPVIIQHMISPSVRIPALFYALFSVFNIWLVWRIVLTAGAEKFEALMAAFLLSCSTTFFYYVRHLLPYDIAMTFCLLCMVVALKNNPTRRDALLCGLLASFAFLTYNGYWTFAGFCLIIHTAQNPFTIGNLIRRAIIAGLGLVAPILSILGLDIILGEGTLVSSALNFSTTINQGDFQEGWSLPFEYLWHAEHSILLIMMGAIGYSLYHLTVRPIGNKYAWIWFVGFCFIYLCLFLFSVVFEKFMVYGRLARQLVPFLCLLGAFALNNLRKQSTADFYATIIICCLILVQTGFNFYKPLAQKFPVEFIKEAKTKVSNIEKYQFVYTDNYPARPGWSEVPKIELPPHTVVLRAPHPLQYLPYQYEGWTHDERVALRSIDFSMKLIRIDSN